MHARRSLFLACSPLLLAPLAAGQATSATRANPRPDLAPSGMPVYVSVAGTDAPGRGLSANLPVRTLSYGLALAQSAGLPEVWVAVGAYDETLTIVDGISVRGGHAPDFGARNPSAYPTILNLFALDSGPTVVAQDVSTPTEVSGLFVVGPLVTTVGASSVAVELIDCSSALTLKDNVVVAGPGARGSAGHDGGNGPSAAPALAGFDGVTTSDPSCQGTSVVGGAGGLNTCAGGATVGGGDGGSSTCPVTFGSTPPNSAFGDSGQGSGAGAGGAPGWAGVTVAGCFVSPPPGHSISGADGQDGADGNDGPAGAGAADALGSIQLGAWQGAPGQPGTSGAPGGGGGGGGAAWGIDDQASCPDGDVLGPAGGGGGGGGCAGTAGTGGSAGGASIGVLVRFGFDPGPDVPVVANNEIRLGLGGPGGRGGAAGFGARGGPGGAPGQPAPYWYPLIAGYGGAGGDGGHGGGGGGGAGGPALGIAVHGPASIPGAYSLNTFVSAGAAGGRGGSGGASAGQTGGPGVDGALSDVALLP